MPAATDLPTSFDQLGIDLDDPRTALILSLADDDLVMGHQALHWTGVAPSLEEDIAFSGIAQDEINHADVWYQLLTDGTRAAVDALGLGRQPEQYRHAVLCEHEPDDFAYTLARHWFYDHADSVRLEVLADSSDRDIAAIARKLVHEERYHLEHADTWFWRLVRGHDETRHRLRDALERAFPHAVYLFEPTVGEDDAVAAGLLPTPSGGLLAGWLDVISPMLDEADAGGVITGPERDEGGAWRLPGDLFAQPGGRRGEHTDAWRATWQEMTSLYRAHPGARW